MNNIKKLRKEQGLSVTELATKLNMSQGNLTKIENGQIDLKTDIAEKIASVLGVSVQTVLKNEITSTNGFIELSVLNPQALNLSPYTRLPIPAHFINKNVIKPILYIAEDDTMSPLAPKGALVLTEQGDKANFTEDGVYIIHTEKRMLLRRLQQKLDNSINILCEHPAYPPLSTTLESIKIIGKVHGILNFHTI